MSRVEPAQVGSISFWPACPVEWPAAAALGLLLAVHLAPARAATAPAPTPNAAAAAPRSADTAAGAARAAASAPAPDSATPPRQAGAASKARGSASEAGATPTASAASGSADAREPAENASAAPASTAHQSAEGTVQPRHIKLPAPARLLYEVTAMLRGGKYHANADLLWQHDGEHYDARLEIRALSLTLRSQTSIGDIGPQGLKPTQFADKTRNERIARLDRERGRITFSANPSEVPIEPGAQDRLSIVLQLAAMVAGDPAAFVTGGTMALQTVGPTDVETWLFTVKGEETVPFAGAQLRAIKLERDVQDDSGQQVEIWFAPLIGHLPVRLKITQSNGDFVDQRLRAIEKP